jgi:hypothetical protein
MVGLVAGVLRRARGSSTSQPEKGRELAEASTSPLRHYINVAQDSKLKLMISMLESLSISHRQRHRRLVMPIKIRPVVLL